MASLLRRGVISAQKALNLYNSIPNPSPHPLLRSQGFWVSRFSTDTNVKQSFDIDLSNDESKRRLYNRLLYRSRQRGFLELDLILGNWVEQNIRSLDENGIKSLIHLLDLENPDLWKWLTGQEQPPEPININPVFSAVREKVMHNLDSHSAPETRAMQGQPWVKGWDDFKKGRDGPISGNHFQRSKPPETLITTLISETRAVFDVRNTCLLSIKMLSCTAAEMVDGSKVLYAAKRSYMVKPCPKELKCDVELSSHAIRDMEKYRNFCDCPNDQRPLPEEVIGDMAEPLTTINLSVNAEDAVCMKVQPHQRDFQTPGMVWCNTLYF